MLPCQKFLATSLSYGTGPTFSIFADYSGAVGAEPELATYWLGLEFGPLFNLSWRIQQFMFVIFRRNPCKADKFFIIELCETIQVLLRIPWWKL